MPIFEFRCKNCNYLFEEFVFSSKIDINVIACPECGEQKAEKLMSAFSASGFDSSAGFPTSSGGCGTGGFS